MPIRISSSQVKVICARMVTITKLITFNPSFEGLYIKKNLQQQVRRCSRCTQKQISVWQKLKLRCASQYHQLLAYKDACLSEKRTTLVPLLYCQYDEVQNMMRRKTKFWDQTQNRRRYGTFSRMREWRAILSSLLVFGFSFPFPKTEDLRKMAQCCSPFPKNALRLVMRLTDPHPFTFIIFSGSHTHTLSQGSCVSKPFFFGLISFLFLLVLHIYLFIHILDF